MGGGGGGGFEERSSVWGMGFSGITLRFTKGGTAGALTTFTWGSAYVFGGTVGALTGDGVCGFCGRGDMAEGAVIFVPCVSCAGAVTGAGGMGGGIVLWAV